MSLEITSLSKVVSKILRELKGSYHWNDRCAVAAPLFLCWHNTSTGFPEHLQALHTEELNTSENTNFLIFLKIRIYTAWLAPPYCLECTPENGERLSSAASVLSLMLVSDGSADVHMHIPDRNIQDLYGSMDIPVAHISDTSAKTRNISSEIIRYWLSIFFLNLKEFETVLKMPYCSLCLKQLAVLKAVLMFIFNIFDLSALV